MMERCKKSLHHVLRCSKMFDRHSKMFRDALRCAERPGQRISVSRSDGFFDGNKRILTSGA